MNREKLTSHIGITDPEWITIGEATKIVRSSSNEEFTDSDIYRHALYGDITLSIYFQSPIIIRKVRVHDYKVILRPVTNSFIQQLCFLDRSSLIHHESLIVSSYGEYILADQRIIDTSLSGQESLMVQHLLARSLNLPLPEEKSINHGISVIIGGEIFQIFEQKTWMERIKKQMMGLPENISLNIYDNTPYHRMRQSVNKEYFPLYYLPDDAIFVIRYSELEKFIKIIDREKAPAAESSRTRISTPLSRLFWLACRHNDTICSLMNQPYKLLSIFEQWAAEDGITDRLSGDTIKTSLERGSPSSASLSNS
ncbi:hypothetical protein [Klebsiella pneumoniae]|uniref:hypothetical protein n=1 Tax=Klebsiella pneumoniae TaxID=573 RepID=UPI00203A72CA|nr:hypothetical protein [Klebsiella pneumoniae]USB65770.1 hypothetical protein KU669_02535 [Klebsiella pneumoniae]HBT4769501.1 hypothetical protein [Klebsiella variicola subsp. variicola]HBT4923618.1 hypothetical protein [Klebsiella pneumoniae]HCB1396541.1 hypothetical protein [Klebsiella pneumoniae]